MASTETAKPDPALMGVSIPLNVTVSAAKEVGAAWQKFGMDLMQAVKTARDKPAEEKEKSAKEASAAAAAGVSA